MTTIAFDGRTIAVDQGVWNNGVAERAKKLFDIPEVDSRFSEGVVIATCGYAAAFEPLVEHITTGREFKYKEYELQATHVMGLLCAHEGVYKIFGDARLSLLMSPFSANGAGYDFVMGALAAGASATKAVELTMHHTDYAKFGVDAIDLSQRFPNAKLYRL